MSDDDRSRVTVWVDEDTHSILKRTLKHGELSHLVRDFCRALAHGGDFREQDAVDRLLEERRGALRDLRDKRREVEAEIEAVENEIAELEQRRDSIDAQAEQYEGALWTLETALRAGDIGHLDPDHPRLRDIAQQWQKTAAEVHDQLKERNPDVPDYAFKQRMHAPRAFDGLEEEAVTTPVAERGGEP